MGTHKHTEQSKNKIKEMSNGENNSNARLTNEDIFEIIELSKTNMKHKNIAMIFGVNEPMISRILSGDRWSSVTGICK